MYVSSVKYADRPLKYGNHCHDRHQLLYVVEGDIIACVEGKEYRLRGGSLLILSRFEEHSIQMMSPGYKRYRLIISPEQSHRGFDNYLLASVFRNRASHFCHAVDTGEFAPIFEKLLISMKAEEAKRSIMFEDMLDLYLKQFLIELYRCAPDRFLSESTRNTATVKDIQIRFERSPAENYTLKKLAEEYLISASYLSHSFKEITGFAPMEYLQACRLSAAKKYLTESDMPIKEIIAACGFCDESNFCRMFKKVTGLTPSTFRKMNRIQ